MKPREFWNRIEEFVFFTTTETGWERNWDVFMLAGEPVTDMQVAKEFVRTHMKHKYVGLANFEQMSMNNAQWDNM